MMPNLPTALEQGTDVQTYAWTALFLPRRTPDTIVQTLNKAVVEALAHAGGAHAHPGARLDRGRSDERA